MNLSALTSLAIALIASLLLGASFRALGLEPAAILLVVPLLLWWLLSLIWHVGTPWGWAGRLSILDAAPKMLFVPVWVWAGVTVGFVVATEATGLGDASRVGIGAAVAALLGLIGLAALRLWGRKPGPIAPRASARKTSRSESARRG